MRLFFMKSSCLLFTGCSPQMFFIRFLESKAFITGLTEEFNFSIFNFLLNFLYFKSCSYSFSWLSRLFNFIFLELLRLNFLWFDNLVWSFFKMLLFRLDLNVLWIAFIWVFRLNLLLWIIFHSYTISYNYVRFNAWISLLVLLLLLLFPLPSWHVFVMLLLNYHTPDYTLFDFLFWNSRICEYV